MSKNSGKSEEKVCFIISPIGEKGSETRKKSDQVLKFIIKPVIDNFNFKLLRADKISEPGIITSQIIEHVTNSELVIADLSGHNPNVFYELAIRHVIKRPFIQLIEKGESIPFDVTTTRTIKFDLHDLENVESAKRELEKTIKNIQKGKLEIDTPISVAIELRAFKESEKPLENSIGEMLEIISTINIRMSNMDNKFDILKNIEDKITNPSSSRLFGTYGDSIEDYEIVHDPLENKYRFKKKSGWLL